jgi:hypothetical protein
VNAGTRQLNHLSQVNADEVFHLGLTHRGVLQDVDGRVVGRVGKDIAKGKRYLCLG